MARGGSGPCRPSTNWVPDSPACRKCLLGRAGKTTLARPCCSLRTSQGVVFLFRVILQGDQARRLRQSSGVQALACLEFGKNTCAIVLESRLQPVRNLIETSAPQRRIQHLCQEEALWAHMRSMARRASGCAVHRVWGAERVAAGMTDAAPTWIDSKDMRRGFCLPVFDADMTGGATRVLRRIMAIDAVMIEGTSPTAAMRNGFRAPVAFPA